MAPRDALTVARRIARAAADLQSNWNPAFVQKCFDMSLSLSSSPQPFSGLTRAALADWCAEQGHETYRADQIRRWLFGKRVTDFEEMHDVPATLRSAAS